MQTNPVKDAEKALTEARRELEAVRKDLNAKQHRVYALQNALYKARNATNKKITASGHSAIPEVDEGLRLLRANPAALTVLGASIQQDQNGDSILVAQSLLRNSTTRHVATTGNGPKLPFLNATAKPGQTLFAYTVHGGQGHGLLIGEAQTANGKIVFTSLILRSSNKPDLNLLKR